LVTADKEIRQATLVDLAGSVLASLRNHKGKGVERTTREPSAMEIERRPPIEPATSHIQSSMESQPTLRRTSQ
jgi:hypothetical protein